EDAVAGVAAVERPGRVGAEEVGADDVARRVVDGDAVAGVGGDDVALAGPGAADLVAGAVDDLDAVALVGLRVPVLLDPDPRPDHEVVPGPVHLNPGAEVAGDGGEECGVRVRRPDGRAGRLGAKEHAARAVTPYLGEADLADGAGVHRVIAGVAGDGDAVPNVCGDHIPRAKGREDGDR